MTKEKEVEVDEAVQHRHLFFISCDNIIMNPFFLLSCSVFIFLTLRKLYLEKDHIK